MELRGIDIHVHPQTEEVIKAAGERGAQMARYFGRADRKPVSFAEMADRYRDLGLMCCLMNSTDITTTGQIPVPNDHLARRSHRIRALDQRELFGPAMTGDLNCEHP